MTEMSLASQAGYLIGVARRAPSLYNTQPWHFTVSGDAIELQADGSRQLLVDPDGREMIISCGAALYGLRLAVRSLGYLPEVRLLPGPALRYPLARVLLGPAVPMTADERKLLHAVPHRHTHRGPFEPEPLPAGLLARLREDAAAEGATLADIGSADVQRELARIAATAGGQDRDPASWAEAWQWSHEVGSPARDGVPAHSFPADPGRDADRLPQRDFDLGRGIGRLTAGGPAPPATAVLLTAGDEMRDWLRAGQALQRLLLRAATQWVFARLNSEPLEDVATRALVADCLARTGSPQMLMELGISRTAHATTRRPAADLT